MIKAVFFDVDGTLYSHAQGAVPPSALRALYRLREKGILGVQWTALKSLASLTLVVCVLFPLISQYMVIPYLSHIYRSIDDVIAQSNLWIMSLMVFLLVLLPLRFGKGRKSKKMVITNLAGENLGEDVAYRGAAGRVVPVTLRNWYMETWFNERKMQLWGYTACVACLLMELSLATGGVFHV